VQQVNIDIRCAGVKIDDLLVCQPDSGEMALDVVRTIARLVESWLHERAHVYAALYSHVAMHFCV
jgi:hypothetical protein